MASIVLNQAQAAVVFDTPALTYWDARLIAGDAVVENGECYFVGEECSADRMRGYGGARWLIRFRDGRELCTSNLWHNGAVPATHRRALPDNATITGIALPRIMPDSPDDITW